MTWTSHRWIRILRKPNTQITERCKRCGMLRRLSLKTVWYYKNPGAKTYVYCRRVPACGC